MSTTTGRAYIDRRVALVVAGNFDAVVEEGYNDDAPLVSFDGQIRGKEALKAHFRQHLPAMGKITLKSIDKYAETGDSVFVEMTVATSNYGEVTSFEAFVLRGGKADYHFTALR
jgi:hypothetical protein